MATITNTVTVTNSQGTTCEFIIERTREVHDKIVNADGDMINLGKETKDLIHCTLKVNGSRKGIDYGTPSIITERFYGNYKELVAKGVYARFCDIYITEATYNLIMAAFAEIEAELAGDPEYNEIKAAEQAREAKEIAADVAADIEYNRQIKNGLCPKCGTYCYGDCEAN